MGFQIDYMPVGNGEKSGDAIALRYGNLHGTRDQQTVVVIDGGTKDAGEALVDHILQHYSTDTVDYVFSTHLDSDHLSGLTVVLEKLKVGKLYMHIPWEHIDEVGDLFEEEFTDEELEQELKESLELVHEVESLAFEKDIPIEEPFAGTPVNNELVIFGPTKTYYEQLLCEFRQTPPSKKSALEQAIEAVKRAAETAVEWVEDRIDIDILTDSEKTSAENNSSVVLVLVSDEHKLLFTGDAGIKALTQVADLADRATFPLTDLRFMHVPHHGSKHNLGSSILKRIKGETAFISATGETSKHPSKKIMNALIKHGANVYVTRGRSILHHHDDPDRGWSSINAEEFSSMVEN